MFGNSHHRLASVAALFLFSGCYASTPIPASELPQLNGMSAQSNTTGNAYGSVTLVTQTVQTVRALDGRIVQLQGEVSAEVVPRDPAQTTVRFDHPIQASVADQELRVAGGNRAEMAFPLVQVDHVNVITLDQGLTSLATTLGVLLGSLAGGGIAMGVIFAVIL